MSKIIVFVQVHGQGGVLEAELSDGATLRELRATLKAAGIDLVPESFIFIDESEEHVCGEEDSRVGGLRHGCRIHICRCKHITTTVHYLEKSVEREFPPGARVRVVKNWAIRSFDLNSKDAAEHVLQICKSADRPSTDTPLHQLLMDCSNNHEDQGHGRHCALCFDLVPDKRVEG